MHEVIVVAVLFIQYVYICKTWVAASDPERCSALPLSPPESLSEDSLALRTEYLYMFYIIIMRSRHIIGHV